MPHPRKMRKRKRNELVLLAWAHTVLTKVERMFVFWYPRPVCKYRFGRALYLSF